MSEENLTMKEEDSVKWVQHYSSSHHILLVGEGDFSFSMCLARSFGSASNIVATSLDGQDVVVRKYRGARSNLGELERLGATLLHGVDATRMKLHTDLRMRKFDRIVFNFPHAGFHGKEDQPHQLRLHRKLVRDFFKCASQMLRPYGEVHVNHKTTKPFCCWKLEELASKCCLDLLECVEFQKSDYPGYNNKRGDGPSSDAPFPLGECSTFKFGIISSHQIKKKQKQAKMRGCYMHEGSLLVLDDMPGTIEGGLQIQPPEHHNNAQQCFVEFQFGNPRISIKMDAILSATHKLSIKGMPPTGRITNPSIYTRSITPPSFHPPPISRITDPFIYTRSNVPSSFHPPINQITGPRIYTRNNTLPSSHPSIAYYKGSSGIIPPNASEVVDQEVNSGAANKGSDYHLPLWALGVLRTSSSHSLSSQLQGNDIEIFGRNDCPHHAAAAYMPNSHYDAYENRDGWSERILVPGYKRCLEQPPHHLSILGSAHHLGRMIPCPQL